MRTALLFGAALSTIVLAGCQVYPNANNYACSAEYARIMADASLTQEERDYFDFECRNAEFGAFSDAYKAAELAIVSCTKARQEDQAACRERMRAKKDALLARWAQENGPIEK